MNGKNDKATGANGSSVKPRRASSEVHAPAAAASYSNSDQYTGPSRQYGSAAFGESESAVAGQGWSRATDLLENLSRRVDLKGNMERHPFAVLGAAFGIGYLLGGGRFGALLLGAGARALLVPLVRNQVTRFAEGAYEGLNGDGNPTTRASGGGGGSSFGGPSNR